MAWSPATVSSFIEMYCEEKHLWDHKDINYFKRSYREATLQKIAEKLGKNFTVKMLKAKWSNLRTQFVKEEKINKEKMKSGAGTDSLYVSRWEYFQQMKFLRDSLVCDDNLSNLDDKVEMEFEVSNGILSGQHFNQTDLGNNHDFECEPIEDIENDRPVCSNNNNSGKSKKRKALDYRDAQYQSAKNIIEKEQSQCDDTEETFGKYVTAELKSLPPLKRNLLKLNFQQLIMKMKHDIDIPLTELIK